MQLFSLKDEWAEKLDLKVVPAFHIWYESH